MGNALGCCSEEDGQVLDRPAGGVEGVTGKKKLFGKPNQGDSESE